MKDQEIIEEVVKSKIVSGPWDNTSEVIKVIKKALSLQRQEFLKEIDYIDIDLMFTDIKDSKGKVNQLSDEVMEIIKLWWNMKSRELKERLNNE